MDMSEVPEELRDTVKRLAALKPGERMEIYRLHDRLDIQVTNVDRKSVKLPTETVEMREIR